MALPAISYFRARLVDVVDNQKVFGIACGVDMCSNGYFDGRLVDVVNGEKVFAIPGEANSIGDCCEYPTGSDPLWVELPDIALVKNIRISYKLKIRVEAVSGCAAEDCQDYTLTYNGTSWVGTVADNLVMTITYDGTKPSGEELQVAFTGCYTNGSGTAWIVPTCGFPFVGVLNITIPVTTCCICGGTMILHVYGYCNRYHMGRLVDVVDRQKVFELEDCCTKNACVPRAEYCCEAIGHCNIWVTITDSSSCGCFGSSYELIQVGADQWSYNSGGTFTSCGVTWAIVANCYTHSDGSTYIRVTISGTSATCTYTGFGDIQGYSPCWPVTGSTTFTIVGTPKGPFTCCNPAVTVVLSM